MEISKLKARERVTFCKKYKTIRIAFWKEMRRGKAKQQNVQIFSDLFATPVHNDNNRIFDNVINNWVRTKKNMIESSRQHIHVNEAERMEIMRNLSLSKSPGLAKVRCELIKYSAQSRSIYFITKFFEKLLILKVMPKNMNMGTIVPIIKDSKGSVTSIKNVRGITLSDVMSIITP